MTRETFGLADYAAGISEWGGKYRHLETPGIGEVRYSETEYRFENYTRRRGLLVPRQVVAFVSALLVSNRQDEQWSIRSNRSRKVVGDLRASVEIRNGVPTLRRVDAQARGAVTQDFLNRIPVSEIGNRAVAQLSLTDRQGLAFVVDPTRDFLDWQEAGPGREPVPVVDPPLPDLIDPTGRPWWVVSATEPASRQIDRLKRPQLTGDFLSEVLRVATEAAETGRRDTTQAVCDWHEERTGRRPGTSTARKWIASARRGEGKQDA